MSESEYSIPKQNPLSRRVLSGLWLNRWRHKSVQPQVACDLRVVIIQVVNQLDVCPGALVFRLQLCGGPYIPMRIIGKVDSGTDLRPSRSTLQDCIYFAQHRASRYARCVAMQVWLLVPQKR